MTLPAIMPERLHLVPTRRFCVLEAGHPQGSTVISSVAPTKNIANGVSVGKDIAVSKPITAKNGSDGTQYPFLSLVDLLLHKKHEITDRVQSQLWKALHRHGYVFLQVPPSSAPHAIVESMKEALHQQFFPDPDGNGEVLATSDVVYISERSVPMWRLGYERGEDDIREFFRVHAGCVDDQPWPSTSARQTWLQGLALCRHICDVALDLVLEYDRSTERTTEPCNVDSTPRVRSRPSSGVQTWKSPKYSSTPEGQIPDRAGDSSVLYAMHYFNTTDLGETEQDETYSGICLKPHVDPSLFVVEPFLCQETRGLQVYDPYFEKWLDCDGPTSPVHGQDVMCLFMGKALSRAVSGALEPTLHQVVSAETNRRTVIYEQKYEEFYE